MKLAIQFLFWLNALNIPFTVWEVFHYRTALPLLCTVLSGAYCWWVNPYAKKNQEVTSDQVSDRP